MKWLFKWIFRLVLLVVVLIVVLILSLDSILKAVAERRIRSETGMDVKIGKFSVGLISPVITVKDFKLYNTAEFGGTVFVDIPELHVEYDAAALAQQKLRVTLMRFNLAELSVVKNEAGRTNIFELMAKSPAGKKTSGGAAKALHDIKFTGIDVLNLSLGKVRYIDLKNPGNSRELKLNVRDNILKNVKSESDLYGVLALIWLRNGFTLGGNPMSMPPQLFSFPNTTPQNSPKQ